MENNLKNKILTINFYSISLIVLIFSILNFIVVYFVLNDTYKKEISIIKEQYISSQKAIIKNQINNCIDFINHTRRLEKKSKLRQLKTNVQALSNVLSFSNPKNFKAIILNSKIKSPFFDIGLSDIHGNIVFATNKSINHSQLRHKALKKGFGKIIILNTKKGIKYSYILKFRNKIDNKEYIIGNSIFQSTLDNIVKKIVIDRVNTLRFGANNNGYISIGEILNYHGGKAFAKIVALPIKPSWVGRLLDSDTPDAKGNFYRKKYIDIINTTGEGFVKYWFYKEDKNIHPKISYIKLYKPFNWVIFSGVYLDDIQKIVNHKKEMTKKEMENIFSIYLIISAIFLIIAYMVSKYENNILNEIIEDYEKVIDKKNQELVEINKNLEKEVEEKTEELLEFLLTDTLTNLPNREKLILDIRDKEVYIAILNLDSFKEINDFYGIDIGDEVLRKFAHIIKYSISENSYKLSADEFAIVDDDLEKLEKLIQKLVDILSHHPLEIYDEIINISFNCGIGKTLIEADMALKYAKKHKYEAVVVFSEELNIAKEYEKNIKWKSIINEAIAKDNILAYVQPIVNNKTKKTEKYECLVRLKHNDEIYSPYYFLDIAKHTGKYYKIQQIMIEKTFAKFSKLDYSFSINLALQDLVNDKFKNFLLEQIDKYQVQNKLIIELLEDDALLESEVLEFLYILKNKNIKIAIDDFGSGYSNFAYLIKGLPVSILKIDGSLVKDIAKSQKDYKLLRSITKMAKEFDFELVAEFVENKEIYEILKELDIDYSQGYYFSAPFDINNL